MTSRYVIRMCKTWLHKKQSPPPTSWQLFFQLYHPSSGEMEGAKMPPDAPVFVAKATPKTMYSTGNKDMKVNSWQSCPGVMRHLSSTYFDTTWQGTTVWHLKFITQKNSTGFQKRVKAEIRGGGGRDWCITQPYSSHGEVRRLWRRSWESCPGGKYTQK